MRGPTILLAMALTGCAAHSGAMRSGNQAAAYGSWDEAVAAYEDAVRISPDSDRARSKLDAARASQEADRIRRLDDAARRLASAMSRADWQDAAFAMSEVRTLDPLVAGELGLGAYETLRPRILRLLAAGELTEAYPLAMVVSVVHGEPASHELLGSVMTALNQRVSDDIERGDWASAVGMAEWMDEVGAGEPGRVATMRADWAGSIASTAKTAESSGHLGSAAARYHQAYGVNGDRVWLAERDRAAAKVEDALRYELRWPNESAGLASAVQARTETALLRDDRVRIVQTGAAQARLDVDITERACDDTVEERVETVQVLVGSRPVTNPDYEPAMRALRTAEVELSRLSSRHSAAQDAASTAERAASRLIDVDLPSARATAERAEADVSWATRRVHEAEDALQAARAACVVPVADLADDAAPATADPEVVRLERELEIAQTRLLEVERIAAAPRSALVAVQRKVADAEAVAERARRDRIAAQRAVEQQSTSVAQRTAQVDRTPLTVPEDVFEPFGYPVQTWTRTCAFTASARHREDGIDRTHRFESVQQTTDVWHEGYPTAGVSSDPLRFPESDATLRAAAEASLADAVTTHILDASHRYYVGLWDGALDVASDNPAAALDAWLAVSRLDPSVTDDRGRAVLGTRTGIVDASWMRQR